MLLPLKQRVALTERNTTGPPSRAAHWRVTLLMRSHEVLQTTTDDKEHKILAPFTMCNRASNKATKRRGPEMWQHNIYNSISSTHAKASSHRF